MKRLNLWLRKQELLRRSRQCYAAAFRIYRIGFQHPPRIQDRLNAAKDELYRAAREFERSRCIIEGDQMFERRRRFARKRLQIIK